MDLASRFPVGQYVPRESALHALDPRAKILATLALIVAVFLLRTFGELAAAGAALLLLIAIAKIPVGYALRSVRPLLPLLVLTIILNMLFPTGEVGRELFRAGPLIATEGGLRTGIFVAARLAVLVVLATLLTLTTAPVALTDGLERLLQPLARIGVPAHDLAMMTTIALRFIPTLLEETEKIMKAQMARGAEFDRGGIAARVRAFLPVLVPLMVSAFRRSEELALAMEARGYHGGTGRTRMRRLRWRVRDTVALALTAAGIVALLRVP